MSLFWPILFAIVLGVPVLIFVIFMLFLVWTAISSMFGSGDSTHRSYTPINHSPYGGSHAGPEKNRHDNPANNPWHSANLNHPSNWAKNPGHPANLNNPFNPNNPINKAHTNRHHAGPPIHHHKH